MLTAILVGLIALMLLFVPKYGAFVIAVILGYPLIMLKIMIKHQLWWTLAGLIATLAFYVGEVGSWQHLAFGTFGIQAIYNTIQYIFIIIPRMWGNYERLNA